MDKESTSPIIKMLVTIVDRKKTDHVAEFFQERGLHANFAILGVGTASSEILDYLGLGETDKGVILSLIPQDRIAGILKGITDSMQLSKPGKGICFTLPLSGISQWVLSAFEAVEESNVVDDGDSEVSGGADMEDLKNSKHFDLILAVVEPGHVDQIMTAAKAAGATGGTVLSGRDLEGSESGSFFGIAIRKEKELIGIVADHEKKQEIMKAICSIPNLETDSNGMVLSIPVDEMVGIGGKTE